MENIEDEYKKLSDEADLEMLRTVLKEKISQILKSGSNGILEAIIDYYFCVNSKHKYMYENISDYRILFDQIILDQDFKKKIESKRRLNSIGNFGENYKSGVINLMTLGAPSLIRRGIHKVINEPDILLIDDNPPKYLIRENAELPEFRAMLQALNYFWEIDKESIKHNECAKNIINKQYKKKLNNEIKNFVSIIYDVAQKDNT
jgi:hypothetical protein